MLCITIYCRILNRTCYGIPFFNKRENNEKSSRYFFVDKIILGSLIRKAERFNKSC